MQIRRLIHFLLIGLAAFTARSLYTQSGSTETPAVTVHIAPSAKNPDIEREIEKAILLDQAIKLDWHLHDPVVYEYTVRNMRFIEDSDAIGRDGRRVSTSTQSKQSNEKLFELATQIGMPFHDPVVRTRLYQRARNALERIEDDQLPTPQDLENYLDKHTNRFERPATVRFAHVFSNLKTHGDALLSSTESLRDKLVRDKPAPENAYKYGDPLLQARPIETRTYTELDQTYGQDIASALETVPKQTWTNPIRSVYGMHLFHVLERIPRQPAALRDVENQVRGAYLRDLKARNYARRYAALRARYSVKIERN